MKKHLEIIYPRKIRFQCAGAIVAAAAATFLFTGCGKKAQAPAPAAPPAQPVAQSATEQNNDTTIPTGIEAQTPAVTSNIEQNATAMRPPTVAELKYAVRAWARGHGHFPKDFEEFAADPNPGLVIPPPPAGKKYAFKDAHYDVILVDK
jgi:hypothetical protein